MMPWKGMRIWILRGKWNKKEILVNWGFAIYYHIPYFPIILDNKAYFAKNFSQNNLKAI